MLFSLPHLPLLQRDADGRAVVGDGGGGDGVAEAIADRAAEVEAEAAGLLVAAAIVAGIALFKDARQVLSATPMPVSRMTRVLGASSSMVMLPARVYLSALDKTCSITNSSHFSSVTHDTFSGS